MGHIQRERLPKSKMAPSDDRLNVRNLLRLENELTKELCCRWPVLGAILRPDFRRNFTP